MNHGLGKAFECRGLKLFPIVGVPLTKSQSNVDSCHMQQPKKAQSNSIIFTSEIENPSALCDSAEQQHTCSHTSAVLQGANHMRSPQNCQNY